MTRRRATANHDRVPLDVEAARLTEEDRARARRALDVPPPPPPPDDGDPPE